ncbi:hypothetical protein [Chryseobacterium sp. PMSZPI]|uniref:hypothetical protein n=1 Tax=Chryseobacterium sp. PMSZPI TaxID=1033900 RepID=UPI000C31E0D0|nr:hypothetical protein [Chryseobacterium sp. PMSZPI]PKF75346.1 hypothetical protein CW752_04585 [Chryseobacterium sp. PMSZPI]
MKKLIISSLAMAVIISCSSSNDDASNNNDNNNNTPYLLKKSTEIAPDGSSYVVEYKYNGTKIIESYDVTDKEKVAYTYNGDNIEKAEVYRDGVLKITREYSYSNGKLVAQKVTNKEKGQPLIYTENYQYVSDNHVQYNDFYSATYSPTTGAYSDIKFVQKDVYLNNGNIISSSFTNMGTTHSITYVYDGNNHPMKNVTGFVKMEIFSYDDGEMGYSNLLSSNGTFTGILSGNHQSKGIHTLNAANYPTKSEMTYTSSSVGNNKRTYLYEYNK